MKREHVAKAKPYPTPPWRDERTELW